MYRHISDLLRYVCRLLCDLQLRLCFCDHLVRYLQLFQFVRKLRGCSLKHLFFFGVEVIIFIVVLVVITTLRFFFFLGWNYCNLANFFSFWNFCRFSYFFSVWNCHFCLTKVQALIIVIIVQCKWFVVRLAICTNALFRISFC